MSIENRLREIAGRAAVTAAADGIPRVAPDSVNGVAAVLGAARESGWRVRIEGAGSFVPPDAPADLALATTRLAALTDVRPEDLVATVQAGIPWAGLEAELAERGAWLAIDPPGSARRTLGSVIATATTGPLRAAFGPPRDHVLGLTFVTGDGRVVRCGGRVMKNVAGYDLAKLHSGGFGAFGVIVEAHVRLRTLPRADRTLVRDGGRAELLDLADELRAAGFAATAIELLSPGAAGRHDERWLLAARLAGSGAAVGAAENALRAGNQWTALEAGAAHALWRGAAEGTLRHPVTVRAGGLPAAMEDLIDLVEHQLDAGWISASLESGSLRWSGTATAERLRHLRRELAAREVPLTLERAPWAVRGAVGHFGAYREGAAPLVAGLLRAFDPNASLVTAVAAEDRDR